MGQRHLGRSAAVRMGAFIIALAAALACSTSPLGRSQLTLVPEGQVDQAGAQSFEQLKQQTPADTNPADNAFVKCVAGAITGAAKGQTDTNQWEVVVFQDKQINAFALPGGKIGVYSGIIPVTKNDAQLGAVLGHEVSHVIARHGNERMSDVLAAQGALTILDDLLAGRVQNPAAQQAIVGALGLGAQFGVIMPFSRTQESEADLLGLKLMAEAGFDPRQSVELWKNMTVAAGNGPPQFLSDHPSNPNRIAALQQHMPEALQLYQQARSEGKHPSCKHP